jgi:pyruvate/2-oxoacid:ferredoxin oxidoreductase beta subunit
MIETFRAAARPQGHASFVEIYQNCNVFNDGQFDDVTKKQARDEMMINLVHGEPITFGAESSIMAAASAVTPARSRASPRTMCRSDSFAPGSNTPRAGSSPK